MVIISALRVLALLFTVYPAFAEGGLTEVDYLGDPSTLAGPSALGNGGALLGNSEDFANIQYGPAVLAFDERYEVEIAGFLQSEGVKGIQVSLLDSRTGPVTAGVTWRWAYDPNPGIQSSELPGWIELGQSLDNPSNAHFLVAGGAWATKGRRFAVGVTGERWWRSAVIAGEGDGWRLGGSLAGRPNNTLTLAVAGTAPLAGKGARGVEGIAHVNAGFQWKATPYFTLLCDLVAPMPWMLPSSSVGAEFIPATGLVLRSGWYHPWEGDLHSLTGGISFNSDNASFDYGFRLDPWEEGMPAWHVLGIRLKL